MKNFTSKNEKETLAFAKKFARALKGGEIILLIGDLGAGKTTFTRALARALGVKEKIKSPTFTLLNVHIIPAHAQNESRKRNAHASRLRRLVHIDTYRIGRAQDLIELGLLDWIGRPDTVVVVEWGEKIKPLLKGQRHTIIKFRHGKKENERVIKTTLQH